MIYAMECSVSIVLLIWDASYKPNHTTHGLMCLVSFIHTQYFQGSSMVLYVSVLHSFLQLHKSPLYEYSTFYLSTQQLLGI